jgi:hypothetical protein
MDDVLEIRIVGEYRVRDKSMRIVQQKAKTLKNNNMVSESKKFQVHYETLLAELEVFYKKYRDTMVKFGIAPKLPLKVELSSAELSTIKAVQKKHGLKF